MRDNVLDENDLDDVLDEELKEVEPNVGDHGSDDDMIRIGDNGDDVDMANPFNMNFEWDDTY